jgi:hypothetical protein
MSSYHGWTHAPKEDGGTDPIPLPPSTAGLGPTIIIYGGGTTAASGTWMPIPFSVLGINPEAGIEGDYFSWSITDLGDTGNDRYEITTHEKGWYEWELVTHWDQTSTGGTISYGHAVQRITFDSVSGFSFDDSDLRNAADWLDTDLVGGSGSFEMLDNPWLRGTGKIHVPGGRVWKPVAKQVTGTSRGLSGIQFRITYIETDLITDWTFEVI